MVLTNAERQARYKERLKARAALTPAMVEFVEVLRRRSAQTRERIAMLKDGRLGYRDCETNKDLTHEAIAREETMLSEDERIIALYDPEDGLRSGHDEAGG